jgi:hypothetical protein
LLAFVAGSTSAVCHTALEMRVEVERWNREQDGGFLARVA